MGCFKIDYSIAIFSPLLFLGIEKVVRVGKFPVEKWSSSYDTHTQKLFTFSSSSLELSALPFRNLCFGQQMSTSMRTRTWTTFLLLPIKMLEITCKHFYINAQKLPLKVAGLHLGQKTDQGNSRRADEVMDQFPADDTEISSPLLKQLFKSDLIPHRLMGVVKTTVLQPT